MRNFSYFRRAFGKAVRSENQEAGGKSYLVGVQFEF